MIKKILTIFTILVILLVSTTPVLAKQSPDPNANGNSTHNNHGKNDSTPATDRSPANPSSQNKSTITGTTSTQKNTHQNSTHGFDDVGYNRTARIFNGIAWDWCMDKVGNEDWCNDYLGPNKNDRIIMKWNAEWDRGNAEGWSNPPYDAWENNQWNGKVPGGSGDVWHYKIVWVGACGADGTELENGGYCIWGQFAVIMDQGTLDGVHVWFAHGIPTGYGSYP